VLGGLSSNPSHDLSYDLNRSGIPLYIYSTLKKKENGHIYFEDYKSIHVDGNVKSVYVRSVYVRSVYVRSLGPKNVSDFSVLNLSKETPALLSFTKTDEKCLITVPVPRGAQGEN